MGAPEAARVLAQLEFGQRSSVEETRYLGEVEEFGR